MNIIIIIIVIVYNNGTVGGAARWSFFPQVYFLARETPRVPGRNCRAGPDEKCSSSSKTIIIIRTTAACTLPRNICDTVIYSSASNGFSLSLSISLAPKTLPTDSRSGRVNYYSFGLSKSERSCTAILITIIVVVILMRYPGEPLCRAAVRKDKR